MFFFQDKTNVTPVTHSGFWLRRVQAKPVVSLNRHRRSCGLKWLTISLFFQNTGACLEEGEVEDTLSDISTLPYSPRSPRYSPTDPVVCTFFLGGRGGLSFLPRFISFFSSCFSTARAPGRTCSTTKNRRAAFFFIEITPKNNKK